MDYETSAALSSCSFVWRHFAEMTGVLQKYVCIVLMKGSVRPMVPRYHILRLPNTVILSVATGANAIPLVIVCEMLYISVMSIFAWMFRCLMSGFVLNFDGKRRQFAFATPWFGPQLAGTDLGPLEICVDDYENNDASNKQSSNNERYKPNRRTAVSGLCHLR